MYAVIYVPEFFLQSVLRVEPGLENRPVVLINGEEKKPVVLQLTKAARTAGIAEGMTPTQALARCPHVQIKNRSTSQEGGATDALLQCAYSFSPAIESTADGVCTVDLAGLPNLDWQELANEMRQRLAVLLLPAQIGIAENPWLALLAARAGSPNCVVTNSTEFLNALPLESIGPPAETFAILKKWGIHTLGQFIALGKEPLSARLGPEALELHKRAMANATRPLRLVRPPERFEESIEFEHEIETTEPLLFVLRRFLEQLLARLEMMYWVAQELRLRLHFESDEPHEKTFPIPAPTSNVETLFRMLHTYLETLRTEHPIAGLELSAKPGRAINHQFGLFESVLRDPNHFHETLARLTALVGTERVGTPVLEESYRPDAFRMDPVRLDDLPKATAANTAPVRGPALHRFRPPIAATVQVTPNGPVTLKSPGFEGAVCQARGPWRSSGHWWDTEYWGRDEWDVEAGNGRLYRICRQAHGWFVEGVYD
jgi:protein ImuB